MNLDPLANFLTPQQIKTDAESREIFAKDWTTYYEAKAQAVLFPETTAQVQQIVKWARHQPQVCLVPSGGRTGLSGAAVAMNSEVVVSFERMNQISDFNEIDCTVKAEAGVITENLQNYIQRKGFFFPVDFAARGSSQLGGNIATNAGGIKVIRYGLTRDWVAGLTVVTGAGDILRLNQGLIKNAAGYDLRQLFIGSEGTLGFITEAEMKFTTAPPETQVLLLAVTELRFVLSIYSAFRQQTRLQAFEFFSEKALACVVSTKQLTRPFATVADYYLLLEVETDNEQKEHELMACFENCCAQGWVTDGILSQSSLQAREFWRLREDIAECTQAHSPYRNDVSVRVSKIPEFLLDMDHTLSSEYPDFTVIWFGHIGDGNLHLDILKPAAMDHGEFLEKCRRVDQIVYNSVEKFSGSISAEHGVGLTKKPHLHRTRSPAEIAYFRGIKKVFDPDGIMNPGKIFDQ